jgi:hypothetical protein
MAARSAPRSRESAMFFEIIRDAPELAQGDEAQRLTRDIMVSG